MKTSKCLIKKIRYKIKFDLLYKEFTIFKTFKNKLGPMYSLTKFITNITTTCHNIPDDLSSCVLKSPNMYDSTVRCDIAHPERTCLENGLYMVLKSVYGTYKSFFIANLIPVIMYKQKELRTNPGKVLYRLFISLLRSFIFTVGIGCFFPFNYCLTKVMRADRTMPFISNFIACMLANLGIWAESPGRIEETALYILVNFQQAVWNYLKKKFSAKPIPMFANFLFALCVGLFHSAYAQDDGTMKSKYKFVCDVAIDIDRKPIVLRTDIDRQPIQNMTDLMSENKTDLLSENKTDIMLENKIDTMLENKIETILENNTNIMLENKTDIMRENNTAIMQENNTEFISED